MRFLILIIILIIGVSLLNFYFVVRPNKMVSSNNPSNYGVNYINVAFKNTDNITIRGWFIPSSNPHANTIILLHGYPADKGDILPSRLFLHNKYNLLFIDLRYLGESEGNYSTLGVREALDVQAAIKYLHTRGINKVGVWGFSVGGATALLSIRNNPEIKAVVAEAPYARLDFLATDYYNIPVINYIMGNLFRLWGFVFLQADINRIQPAEELQKTDIPVLLIYYKQDQVIKFKHALYMQKAIENKPNIKTIIIDYGQHGQLNEISRKEIETFFEKNLN